MCLVTNFSADYNCDTSVILTLSLQYLGYYSFGFLLTCILE